MIEPLLYDFGYAWPWTLGHLLTFLVLAPLAALAWWRRWRKSAVALGVVAAWALCGALIVHYVLDFNRPMQLPTASFLASGTGRVLDAGAGSGRATIAVLRERPGATVTALDIYSGYFGITDNTPERLHRNARIAGVDDRLEVEVGDMRELPLPSASFEAALSVAAIDHLSADGVAAALREIERVLVPGGQFLMVTIDVDPWLRTALPFLFAQGYFGTEQRAESWRRRMEEAGLTVIEQGSGRAALYLLAAKRGTATG